MSSLELAHGSHENLVGSIWTLKDRIVAICTAFEIGCFFGFIARPRYSDLRHLSLLVVVTAC